MLEKGEKRGERRGEKRGKNVGKVEGLREAVFDSLRTHFGKVPAGLREAIESVEDREKLIELNRAAWQSDSLDEFKRAL